jgi:hypothetical protein
MKQHRGKLVAGLAIAASFGFAAAVQAQPVGAPPSAPAPEMTAPMAAPPPPLLPPPPVAAPGSDSMAGQLGLGAGVTAGTSLIVPGGTIMLKYWLSDVLALMPQVQIKIVNQSGDIDTSWAIAPNAMFLYSPWKTTSTRLNIGGGLGLMFAKWGAAAAAGSVFPNLNATPTSSPPDDMFIAIALPVHIGVEHFFTRWFSMGLAVQDNLLTYAKQGDAHQLTVSIDDTRNITGLGFLFFYTD